MVARPMKSAASQRDASNPLAINLALQGGGSHGAFTWGVIERILDDPSLKLDSVTGTSAGAMNAVALAHGYVENGPAGAKASLEAFWRRVSDAARFSPIQRSPLDVMTGNWTLDNSPGYFFFDIFSRLLSPYETNPANINPLRDILEESIDFERLKQSPLKLYVTATNVRTGLPRVFRNAEMTADVVLASACLPLMHQSVTIDGDSYWDGGFSGNPLLTPLIHESEAQDTLLVQINPVERQETPRTAREILDRLNEISFNSSLKKELRGIAMFRRAVAEDGNLDHVEWIRQWSETRLHRITSPTLMSVGASSKLNAEWAFLNMLREEGQGSADQFLQTHAEDLGVRSTFDFDAILDTVLEQV